MLSSPVIISSPAGYNIGYNPSPITKMPQAGGRKKKAGKKKQTGGKVNWAKVGKFILDANRFVKDNKLVSKGATFLNDIGVPYAGRVAAAAAKQGYGKQRGGAVKFR